MQLNFKIKDDHIQLLNAAITPINKSVNYLTAAFDFDDVWDGTRVTAVFCGRNNSPVSVLLDGLTNICVIPWEALQSDILKVSAYGIKENNGMTVRITSNTVELKLDKAGPVEGAEPATPSFTSWEQVVSRINDIEAGIVTDGSIGIAKLGDDVMQILNGKAEQSNLSETNEDIKGLKTTIESLTDDIMGLSVSLEEKEDMIHIHTLDKGELEQAMVYGQELSDHLQYRCGEVTSLTLNLPNNTSDDYISSVIFTSGATATNLVYPDTIKMLGEDCIDCVFTPVANKRYEVIISYDGVNFVGVVGGYGV